MITHWTALILLFPLAAGTSFSQNGDNKKSLKRDDEGGKRISTAARENPIIREYFRSLYQSGTSGQPANDNFAENLVDRQIDLLVEQTAKKTEQLVQQASSIRDMSSELDRQGGAAAAGNRKLLEQILTGLKRTRELTDNLQDSLSFIFSTVRVKRKTEIKIPGSDEVTLIQSYSNTLHREVSKFNERIEGFFFSANQQISVEDLQNEGTMEMLSRILRISEKMDGSIRERLLN